MYRRIFSKWRVHAATFLLRRQAFVDRLAHFRRVHLLLFVWNPLYRNWLTMKVKHDVQKKREMRDLKGAIFRWKSANQILARKRVLLENFLNFLMIPIRNLYFRFWKVRTSIGIRVKNSFLKREIFTRWQKLLLVTRYSRTFQMSKTFSSWKFIISRRKLENFLFRKKRMFLYHLLQRKYSRFSYFLKLSFTFWRAVTLASYYSIETTNQEINWRNSGLERLSELVPRRQHVALLTTIRSSQAGRVFLFKDALDSDNQLSSKIRYRTRFEKLNNEVPFLNLLDPSLFVVKYRTRCEAEYKQYVICKAKYQAQYYLKRTDPIFQQASILESEDISLRKKLNIILTSDGNPSK